MTNKETELIIYDDKLYVKTPTLINGVELSLYEEIEQ
jgi:hypothetical protein